MASMFQLRYLPLLLVLTGCGMELEQLRALAPEADTFPSALAAEYLAYSESELELGRKDTSEHFAEKGLKAGKGDVVGPDEVAAGLGPKATKKLLAARESLVAALTEDVTKVAGQKSARAQLMFDCWN